MERLKFKLPEALRLAWASEPARATWAPRLDRITAMWQRVEKESVGKLRPAGLVFASAAELPGWRNWCNDRNLALLPVSFEGVAAGNYAASSTSYQGGAWRARLLVCEPAAAGAVQEAYLKSSEFEIGELLGYPRCCTEFYQETWVNQRWIDTTYPMAENSDAPYFEQRAEPKFLEGERNFDVCIHRARTVETGFVIPEGAPESNILLRWLGLRFVPHLPCTFACAATIESGKQYADLARSLKFTQEVDWLYEILSWPMEWSALHGIGELKTPVLKFTMNTDASPHRWAVHKEGSAYPTDGASGIVFPYRKTSSKKASQRLIKPKPAEPSESQDNGFSTAAAEQASHAVLLQAVQGLELVPGPVLDLGCGNGKLVKALCTRPDLIPCGVERTSTVAERARRQLNDAVVTGTIDGQWPLAAPYSLIVFMPGRLLEMPEAERDPLRQRLLATRTLLLYVYGDWLKRGDLATLAEQAGLSSWVLGPVAKSSNAQAAVAQLKIEHDHQCDGSCCERFTLRGGASPTDLKTYLQNAEQRIATGRGAGYDFDAPILIPTLEVVQEPTATDPKWYYRCGHHDKTTGLCTIYDKRPKLCREYPSYCTGGKCEGCGFVPQRAA